MNSTRGARVTRAPNQALGTKQNEAPSLGCVGQHEKDTRLRVTPAHGAGPRGGEGEESATCVPWGVRAAFPRETRGSLKRESLLFDVSALSPNSDAVFVDSVPRSTSTLS